MTSDLDSSIHRAAICEAGHAVICYFEGLQVEYISLWPQEGAISFIDVVEPEFPKSGAKWSFSDRARAESLIRALLAGPAAEEKYDFGLCSAEHSIADEAMATNAAVWRAVDLAGSIESDAPILPRLWGQVAATINRPAVWAAIAAVAETLSECRELEGREVKDIIRHVMRDEIPRGEF